MMREAVNIEALVFSLTFNQTRVYLLDVGIAEMPELKSVSSLIVSLTVASLLAMISSLDYSGGRFRHTL